MANILDTLEKRFNENKQRHQNLSFDDIKKNLNDKLLNTISQMEATDGAPDFIVYKEKILVVDFFKESPKSRTSLCYDKDARVNRKKFPPKSSALEQIAQMGTKLVDETLYLYMQSLEDLDLKTSCWLDTPLDVRNLGGALYGDKRFNRTFIYHNGADSYYGVRGFRSYIEVS